MKALLYCNKKKPYLWKANDYEFFNVTDHNLSDTKNVTLYNGKICVEIDYNTKPITRITDYYGDYEFYIGDKIVYEDIFEEYLVKYGTDSEDNIKNIKAYIIENVKILDKPQSIKDGQYLVYKDTGNSEFPGRYLVPLRQCKSGIKIYDRKYDKSKNVFMLYDFTLLCVDPQELCEILNGMETVIIKRG